jgi:serine/threonine protein phosphatase PrpC
MQKLEPTNSHPLALDHFECPTITINYASEPEREDSLDTLSPMHENPCPFNNITWTCSQRKGYKFKPDNLKEPLPLHAEIEDKYFPSKDTDPSEWISVYGDRIFMIADGHAGHHAPSWFIKGLAKHILEIFNSKYWDFSISSQRSELMNLITAVFADLDDQYTEIKTKEFQKWVKDGGEMKKRPSDDGCTMVVNIVREGWVLNCNVGDSRTVLAQPSLSKTDWIPCFASTDHDMTHPQKVVDILLRGGKFINSSANTFLNVKLPKDGNTRVFHELSEARIFRPMSEEVLEVGCSHRRTLNLTATLGDLLFKIEPPILSSAPDFSFIKLEKTEHLLIMATDGLWDHMVPETHALQNEMMVEKVTSMLSNTLENLFLDSNSESSNQTASGTSLSAALDAVCESFMEREHVHDTLFLKNMIRYDDITMMIVHLDC